MQYLHRDRPWRGSRLIAHGHRFVFRLILVISSRDHKDHFCIDRVNYTPCIAPEKDITAEQLVFRNINLLLVLNCPSTISLYLICLRSDSLLVECCW
jgi:hypothetical protein